MKAILKIFSYCLVSIVTFLLPACTDELQVSQDNITEFEGECNVSFDLQGMPLESALTRTAGDAVNSIRNLYVLMYKYPSVNSSDADLAYAFTTDSQCGNNIFDNVSLTISSSSMEDRNDFNGNETAESKTQKITTSKVLVARGYYKIFVVANLDKLSDFNLKKDDISSPEKLKNLQVSWNSTNISANDAMFGFFTNSAASGYDVINEDAPMLTVNGDSQHLHAWVKRTVSKVTVAFDGSQLHDNVNIYIKSVAIKDIPNSVKLGSPNSPDNLSSLITNGEKIIYTTESGGTNNTRVSKREPYFPNFTGTTDDKTAVENWRKQVHSENTNALYFFENLQGESTGNPDENGSWKQQTDYQVPGIPDDFTNSILKDTKEFGSYIEVEAYYKNERFGSQTEGNIIYRFMLGKNHTNDFNAERNYHYKLTLCFKNNANDVDWHIDYSDQPGIYIPEKIYVSYTYNTPTILPIRIVGHEVSDLSVEILKSNWGPDIDVPHFDGTVNPAGLSTGFLSLSYDGNPRIRENETNDENDQANVQAYWDKGFPLNTMRSYIDGSGHKIPDNELDKFGYKVNTRVTSENQTVFEADIPLFTRPLVIYKWAGWTGANPYYSSPRSAKIIVTGKFDGKEFEHIVDVVQVRRIENPAGIYRRHNNADPFAVTLMERDGEGGKHVTPVSYHTFKSDGAWRAIIYKSRSENGNTTNAWFSITAGSQNISRVGEYIQGDDNAEISFTYRPNGTIAQNEVRNGIIKIEYNNYTCTHYIFVRQGYAPMKIEDSSSLYWHTFNLYSGAEETHHPADGGSLFLRGNLSPAILDTNTASLGEALSSLNVIGDNAGTTTGTMTVATIKNITRKDFSNSNISLNRNNTTYNPWTEGRIPDVTEWATLLNENANATLNRAFGVLYGDGATSTQSTPDNAFRCLHNDVTNGKSSKGMRGTFVYNSDDGRNLFLPIGPTGYGRRKISSQAQAQYGFGDSYTEDKINRGDRAPLYNLWSNEGAIYWGQKKNDGTPASNGKDSNSWDINYKSYDFDYMDAEENKTSACFIRLVQDSAP